MVELWGRVGNNDKRESIEKGRLVLVVEVEGLGRAKGLWWHLLGMTIQYEYNPLLQSKNSDSESGKERSLTPNLTTVNVVQTLTQC